MNRKLKTLIGILAFIILMGGAYVGYNMLSAQFSPGRGELSGGNAKPSQSSTAAGTGSGGESQGQGGKQSSEESGQGSSQGSSQGSDEQSGSSAGDRVKAPDFSVVDADGNTVKLTDFEGKPLVVNFWASWCPPCREEMPHFDKAYEDYGEQVNFMMVDLTDGQRETVKDGQDYIEKKGFKFPVHFDTQQEAAYTYRIRSIPTTLFIDSDGYLVDMAQGSMDEKTLRGYIESIIK